MSIKQHIKPLAGIVAAAGLALALTACGGNSGAATTAAASSSAASDNVITVGASPSPHAEILEAIKPELEARGYELKVVEYSDYVQPNVALSEGDLDANYFQHLPYLENYNTENGTLAAAYFFKNLAAEGKTKYIELNGEGTIDSIKETLISQLS